jgi:hypothetical protein
MKINILKSLSFTLCLGILSVTFDAWFGMRRGVAPILLGVVAGGIGTTTSFTQQYLPRFIWFTTATSPDINIKVAGDGTVWDVPGLAVNEFATIRQLSRTANYYMLQLASGLIKKQTVTYTITNQTAAAFNVYGSSDVTPVGQKAQYYCANSQVCLASSGFTFRNFMYLSFANAGATDRYNITFKDGTQQPYDSRDEFKSWLQLYQNSISAAAYNVDNVSGNISSVQTIPTAQQTAYVYYKNPVGLINTDVYKS